MSERKAECRNCRFFAEHNEDPKQGICKRFPPTAIAVPRQQTNILRGGQPEIAVGLKGVFPPALPTFWCGEHQFES